MASSAPTPRRRVTLFPLVAATYFMVSGGPYGLEDLVRDSGYGHALLILLFTPIFWSIPTALMVGELSSAIPAEGGYYVWVRRALGRFWGFQEAWLSLAASVFDMGIYPTLFVVYLTQLFPLLAVGHHGLELGVAVVATCALWNMRGAREVGRSSLLSGILLLAPFAAIVLLSFLRAPAIMPVANRLDHGKSTLLMGILVAMWNYMGWDNASTIAGEVKNPQRTYPLAIGLAVAAVTGVYLLTVGAAWQAGIDPETFSTGGWAMVGHLLAGSWLQTAVVLGGCVSALASFNSLVMSYSRVPYAMAQDKLLPAIFLRTLPSTGAPWFSILACATAWALALGIGFERLIQLDILLWGSSVVLEFAALVVLRIKEPHLARPFKVPGGLGAAILLGISPTLLVGLAVMEGNRAQVAGMSVWLFALLLAVAGVAVYFVATRFQETRGIVIRR